jgi:PIN domain nuclease of toxin-antitoxin system
LRLLLDTHALIWFLVGSDKLSRTARLQMEDPANDIFVSAVSALEVTTKHRIGKLPDVDALASAFEARVVEKGFLLAPITVGHAALAGSLPFDHKDPFDRLLVAQSLIEEFWLISNEQLFDQTGVRRLW